MLAFCDMATLYLRNVPVEMMERLQRLAARRGMSVSAYTVGELAVIAARADNAALLGDLPDLDVDVPSIVDALDESRSGRR